MINLQAQTLILAPMADLSHPGMRMLIESYGGCDYHYSEMISAQWILFGGPLEHYYESTLPDADRLIFQLVGGEEDVLIEAAHYMVSKGAKAIDINMGCTAPQIMKRLGGCAWMRSPEKARALMGKLRASLDPEISVSAKLRLGEKEDPQALLSFVRDFQREGVDFVALHPKTRKEGKNRLARWDHIDYLKSELSIPIIGNGGITGPKSALIKQERYSADGIMLGRSAIQRPWIFKWIKELQAKGIDSAHFDDSAPYEVDLKQVVDQFYTYLEDYQPEEFYLTRMQRFFCYFYKNFTYSHELYNSAIYNAKSHEAVRKAVADYLESHPEEIIKMDRGI